MNTHLCRRSPVRRAFTLVELLVVIAIIAILAALLLPVLGAAKQRAIRVKCLSNCKQLDTASLSYAGENRERLPVMVGNYQGDDSVFARGTPWPWEIAGPNAVDFLRRYGLTRDVLYDPGQPEFNDERVWNWGKFNRIIGYTATFPGCGVLNKFEENITTTPQPFAYGALMITPENASKRVMVAGVVISGRGQNLTTAAARANYTYTKQVLIPGNPGSPGSPGGMAAGDPDDTPEGDGDFDDSPREPTMPTSPLYARTSHLDRRGRYPVGENIGTLDGGARWK